MSISQIKQISDEEKIEIMQHYLNGGEIESKSIECDWRHAVNPSWSWSDKQQYRKRIYNYPLYFEYNDIGDDRSEKFIVEFTGLTKGTVVQITNSKWEIGHFDDSWYPHTDKNLWKEVETPKLIEKQKLASKYLNGNYICVARVWFGTGSWRKLDPARLNETYVIDYKFIHKKDEHILDAYLKDKSVQIEFNSIFRGWTLDNDFIANYDVFYQYRMALRTEAKIVYEVYRVNKKTSESEILNKLLTENMLKILEDENRCEYTYHKTGRQFEIKLGDKY